jgi:8-oxo-dGTP diphosphatase
MLTVDVVAVAGEGAASQVLLVQRANPPFAGRWALPGGFVDEEEPTRRAAARELREETGLAIDPAELELLGVYDAPRRDPRGWSVSAIYLASLPRAVEVAGADDARDARWFPLHEPPQLAFDHDTVLADARARVHL